MISALEHEFFLSEILGRRVYLKSNRVGRLADVAIVETGKIPEVSHLIVKRSFGYPALLVPWPRVSLISNTEIVIDSDDAASLEGNPQAGTFLLRDHILDKKILDMDDHEVEVVYDVKLVLKSDKLYASEVDFSRMRLFRRMGLRKLANWWLSRHHEQEMVSWIYVQPLPDKIGAFSGQVKLNVLKDNIRDIHPVDLADILEELDGEQRVAVFNQIDPERASDTLEEMEPRAQRALIGALDTHQVAALLDRMTPAQAADVLAALPADAANELLGLIDGNTAKQVQQIVAQHNENILLYATDDYIKMPAATTVQEVRLWYREHARKMEVIMYVYVTNEASILLGVVDIRGLLAAEPNQSLGDIMTEAMITLSADDNLGTAIRMFDRYGYRAIPVTNLENRLLTVVSYRDVRGLKPRLT